MKQLNEYAYYFSIAAGLSLSTSCFLIIGELFSVSSPAWIIAGIWGAALLCLAVSRSISELAGMYPAAPGIRTYFKHAFGDRFSLISVYAYLAMVIFVAGAETAVFASIFTAIFPSLSPWLPFAIIYLGLLLVQLAGVDLPRWAQLIITVSLITSLLILGLYSNVSPADEISLSSSDFHTGGLATLPMLISIAIFLFIGFEWTPLVGMNAASFRRGIPAAMALGIVVNGIVYTLFVLAVSRFFSAGAIADGAVSHLLLLNGLLPNAGYLLALVISLLATITTFNAGFIAGVRLLYLLAREGKAPSFCRRINTDNGVLTGSILTIWSLAVVSAFSAIRYGLQLHFSLICALIICFIYGAILLAVPVMRRKKISHGLFRTALPMPLLYLLSILFFFFTLALAGSVIIG